MSDALNICHHFNDLQHTHTHRRTLNVSPCMVLHMCETAAYSTLHTLHAFTMAVHLKRNLTNLYDFHAVARCRAPLIPYLS